MIGEISSEESGGSKANWISDLLATQLKIDFPKIKALVWFNCRCYTASVNHWWAWPIESSSSSQTAFRNAIASSYYAPGGSFGNLPCAPKSRRSRRATGQHPAAGLPRDAVLPLGAG